MIKGIPLLLIGIGIIVISVFDMYSETVNPELLVDDLDFISDHDLSLIGMISGGILMGLGGLKFILEKQRNS